MNDEQIFERLKQFVIKQRWEYDFPLTRATTVEDQLKVTGEDAIEFLVAYGKQFDVDISNFMAADYFEDEGGFKTPKVIKRALGIKNHKKELTLGHLERGIVARRLDEDVINSETTRL